MTPPSLGLGEGIKREDIKDMLQKDFEVNIDKDDGDIAFITYQMGEAEAKVRTSRQRTVSNPVR